MENIARKFSLRKPFKDVLSRKSLLPIIKVSVSINYTFFHNWSLYMIIENSKYYFCLHYNMRRHFVEHKQYLLLFTTCTVLLKISNTYLKSSSFMQQSAYIKYNNIDY